MNIDNAMNQARQSPRDAGSALIIAGLLDFAGLNIPQISDGLRLAVAGFLLKSV